MKLTWNGHSCFTLECGGGVLVLDPYRDDCVPGCPRQRLTADQILCSHDHRDHGAREVVTLTGRPCTAQVEELHTYHDPEGGALRGENTIHIISADGLRAAHLGDLGCEPTPEQLERLKGLDIMLIPVGGYYTIDARQAKSLVDRLAPRVVIPMHYRGKNFGFDEIAPVEDFLALCDNVVRYDTNTLEITAHTPAQTAVPAFPS